MSTFTYSAMNPSGQKVLGQLNAADRGEALQVLAKQTLMPLTLTQSRVHGLGKVRVKPAAIAAACSLLADQLDTGVPLLKALRVMEQQTTSAGLKTALGRIAERVSDGASLADAMTEQSQLFGDLESRSQMKLDMLMKLLEPLMMVVMAIIVGFLVIALLMPVFEGNGLS